MGSHPSTVPRPLCCPSQSWLTYGELRNPHTSCEGGRSNVCARLRDVRWPLRAPLVPGCLSDLH